MKWGVGGTKTIHVTKSYTTLLPFCYFYFLFWLHLEFFDVLWYRVPNVILCQNICLTSSFLVSSLSYLVSSYVAYFLKILSYLIISCFDKLYLTFVLYFALPYCTIPMNTILPYCIKSCPTTLPCCTPHYCTLPYCILLFIQPLNR